MTNTSDFADRLRDLANRITTQRENVTTEEATKHAFILPFIQMLGYDVFNPSEVTPELVADVGTKKGEKVDYAVLLGGKPVLLFECKTHTSNLKEAEYSQLFRYFHVTDTRFAVLTNGIQYWFFTDLDSPNKMDGQPFLKVDLLNLRDGDIDELKKFTRGQFDVENILSTASELKYVRELRRALSEELNNPSDEFARLLIGKVYSGVITSKVRAQFTPFIIKAYQNHLGEVFSARLKGVIGHTQEVQTQVDIPESETEEIGEVVASAQAIETTAEELEAFMIVRAIGSAEAHVKRIVVRNVQSYCGILFDDNNRKSICRLYLNGKKWQIELFNGESRAEIRHNIGALTDIYQHTDAIRAIVRGYLPNQT